jgi:hypothetical protein
VRPLRLLPLLALAFTLAACDSSNPSDDRLDVPTTYSFERDGQSTVSFSGQTDRLNMVAEMKAYLQEADAGGVISEQVLLDMFANTGGSGGGAFSFTSDRDLRSKTFAPDLDTRLFEEIFVDAAAASQAGAAGVTASNGTAGLLVREGSGSTILVDARGREFTQLVEKGLMGAVFLHQIYNAYLTDAKIGPAVDNATLAEGKNYTAMEHHWDEAFGYFGAPVDFASAWPSDRSGELRYWAKYSNTSDPELGLNGDIMDAFIAGRTAIVNNDHDAKDDARDVLYDRLEVVSAATAVHYLNKTLGYLNEGSTGEAFHALSEAWAFVNALRYSPRRALTPAEIATILDTDLGEGGNFWNATPAGLNAAKAKLVAAYPELAPVRDQL